MKKVFFPDFYFCFLHWRLLSVQKISTGTNDAAYHKVMACNGSVSCTRGTLHLRCTVPESPIIYWQSSKSRYNMVSEGNLFYSTGCRIAAWINIIFHSGKCQEASHLE